MHNSSKVDCTPFFHLKKPPFIIEMAENGILDYQGMNQAIYRGATSNIVVDTQSMSIEIGAGNSSHTSNLHFECNHDANVASIKLNSNVTTEFSRSKKLIKYPRVAIASGQSGLGNGYTQDGYTIQVSSEWGGVHLASNVFNNIQAYQTTDHAWLSSNNPDRYTPSTGMATTADTFQDVNGSWVGLTLPEKIKLSSVHLYNRAVTSSIRPARKGIVWGSDGGSTWYRLKDFTNGSMDGALNVITVESDILYDQFRVQITEMHNDPQKDAVAIGELEFYGVPEYDPDADGTDVVVKSVPNVPNTDWLEVYHDAKDLENGPVSTTAGDISGLGGTTNNGTAYGNPQISNGAFVLDGTGDYILTPVNAGLSNHTASMWIVFDNPSTWEAVYYLGPASGLSGGNNIAVYVHSDNYFRVESSSGGSFDFDYDFVPGKWVHMTVLFRGASSLHDCEVYIDNVKLSHNGTSSNPTISYSITGSNNLVIGGRYLTSNGLQYPLEGKIANFRLFNRILTPDEIYQLYAYQKEYFGYGDLSMTLKAGRLGIGISEPRAALDVKGDIYGGCPVFFRVRKSTDTLQGANPIIWNEIMVNKGDGYSTITGKFTAPVSGYYEFIYGGCSGRTDWSAEMHAHKNNGSRIAGASAYAAGGNGHWGRQMMNTVILELKVGETFHLSQPSGNQDMYGGSTYSYNFFSGKYLSN